jgi:hypothetical protein
MDANVNRWILNGEQYFQELEVWDTVEESFEKMRLQHMDSYISILCNLRCGGWMELQS